MRTWTTVAVWAVAAVAIAGCRSIGGGGSCHKPAPYADAESIPPLVVPPGLEAPDTRGALKIPPLDEPAPPPRSGDDPCLDAPPPYSTARPAPDA